MKNITATEVKAREEDWWLANKSKIEKIAADWAELITRPQRNLIQRILKDNEMAEEDKTYNVPSTSDERVVNNVMRHEYRVLTDNEKAKMLAIKNMGLNFFGFLEELGQSRELSLAKTKIEEAVMWAVKHLTK